MMDDEPAYMRICVWRFCVFFVVFSYRRWAKGQATGMRKKFNDSKFKKY